MIKKLLLTFFSGLVFFLFGVGQVHAGTDLSVNCTAIGSCTITPAATPLYNESGWAPGSTVTQKVTVTNSSAQSGFTAVQAANYSDTQNLGHIISLQIRQDTPTGTLLYSATSLFTFNSDGYFTLGPINSGQTINYYFIATMSTAADNQYQGGQVKFDLVSGLELTPIAPPSGGGNGNGGSGGGGGGSVNGATTVASPPVCSDPVPNGAPVVTIVGQGVNTVTLSWTSVSPVTHYGLFFQRVSDGAQYGAPDIGNVTTYTITNLSGGAAYTFQVFGVNGCMPGPRSANATTQQIAGGFIATRPLGNGGQVLGASTSPTPSPSPSVTPSPSPTPDAGQVKGATTTPCTNWLAYVPWILLIFQFILVFAVQVSRRKKKGWGKHLLSAIFTVLSIVLFYLLRVCPCLTGWTWLGWLCKWYWLVAILLTLLILLFCRLFISSKTEEEKEEERKRGVVG